MRVLLVCTGNICRSPAAEVLLREHWGGEWEVSISSAGTQAMVGSPVYSPIRRALQDRDLPDDRVFAARQLTAEMVANADLVLVMTREHRAAVVSLYPAAVRRTFTLREFARVAALAAPGLAPGTVAQRLTALIPVAARLRGKSPASAADDAIEDPYGKGLPVCTAVVDRIEAAVDDIVAIVGKRGD